MYKDFKILKSDILDEVIFIYPDKYEDNRGVIYTSFLKERMSELIPIDHNFIHDKFAISKKDVLRGIHGDEKSWKLITCVSGRIFQVIVDCRKKSSNYLKFDSIIIDSNKPCSVLIPPGFGNAFQVLSNKAVYHYKLAYRGEYLDAKDQFTVKWNDSRLNIPWPNPKPILSNRDK